MISIPDYYFEDKFFQYAGNATRNSSGILVGSCPFCMEGSSWGKKRRFYYYPESKLCSCFNCGITINQVNFIMQMEDKTFAEVMKELRDYTGDIIRIDNNCKHINIHTVTETSSVKLPPDYMNLMDESQVEFYSDEWAVGKARKLIKERRLDTAKYRGDLFMSFEDYIHKNRIIIPFYDEQKKIKFYQSRALTEKQEEFGKYISSLNGKKIFYGLDKLDPEEEYVFVIEGPLDCFFVKNSIGGGGAKLNKSQESKLDELRLFNHIVFCLDNDFGNPEVVKIYLDLINKGEKVFMWGGEFKDYKDFNEYAIAKEVDSIPTESILKYVYDGGRAFDELKLKINSAKKTPLPDFKF